MKTFSEIQQIVNDELKKIADMVTDAVGNDGLYKGFEQCGLFE